MDSQEKPGLTVDTVGTAELVGQILPGLTHAVAVKISSVVPAKHSLLFTPAVHCWKKILHLETGRFPLLSETPKAFPCPPFLRAL